MHRQTRITRRLLGIAVAVAITAHSAPGKGGSSAATLTFDDLAGDAIVSDGLGAYEGSISNRDGSLVVATGSRSLDLDFGWTINPQGISDVTITVSSLDGSTATVNFEPSHHRNPFDRLLVAQAQVQSLPVLTADPRIGRYDVEVVPASA